MNEKGKNVKQRIQEIIDTYFANLEVPARDYSTKLQMLLSESAQALSFVTTLEDEFSIEFEDDEIDINFFLDIDHITDSVTRHCQQATSQQDTK
jgi:acyl carrier protein